MGKEADREKSSEAKKVNLATPAYTWRPYKFNCFNITNFLVGTTCCASLRATTLSSLPLFFATKLEAFRGRGRGDYTNSHDLEDLLTVIDCREAIVSEIAGAMEVRHYIAEQFRTLLATRAFVDALPGYLLPDASSQGRLPILLSRIKEIAK